MRPELKLYFAGLPDAGHATTTTHEPRYSVNLVTIRRGPGMDEQDYMDCSNDVRKYRHRYDAERCAADLATCPIAVAEYAKIHRVRNPEFVVVLDDNGKELARKPILAMHPQKFIGVYRAVFVKDAPRTTVPFDIEDKPVRIYEIDEAEIAMDFAENAAKSPQAGCCGLVVLDHRRKELGRFVSPEAKARGGWRSVIAAAMWRMLGY